MTALRRFVADLFGAYADGVRVARGLPLLFAAIMLWEFAQHAIEVQAGYYDTLASAKALSLDPHRMALGWIKMILVYVGGFFAIRYLVRGDAAGVMRPSGRTVARYVPYALYSLILTAVILYAGSIVPPASVTPARAVVGLAQLAIEPLLMAWIVSAATDGPVRGPVQSARYTGWFYIWALALFFVGRLPINAAHQMLGRSAIGLPPHWVWPMLALDAMVVGLLVAIIPAIYVRVVRRIAEVRTA